MNNEVGYQNAVQTIIDNAQTCKLIGAIMESNRPHIFWTPYALHTLNLDLKDILELRTLRQMKQFMMNAIMSLRSWEIHFS